MEKQACDLGPTQGSEKQRRMLVTEGGHCNGAEGLFQQNSGGCRRQAKESAHSCGQSEPTHSWRGSERLCPCPRPGQSYQNLKPD